MIAKLFKYWRKSKEQKAVRLTVKLIKVLDDIGRVKAASGRASNIMIWEYSHVDYFELTDGYRNKIDIKFNYKGEILK